MNAAASLAQLETEVKDLRGSLKKDTDAIVTRLDNLFARVSGAPLPHSSVSTLSSTSSDYPVLSDSEIPSLYGSIELRQTVAEAQERLSKSVVVLRRVKKEVGTTTMRPEMDTLLRNLETLNDVFDRMVAKMEPNNDTLFSDTLSF